MKHGDKAKKSTKAKASIKKVIGKVAAKIKGSRKEASPKASAKSSSAPATGGNGKGGARPTGPVSFSNPVVGNAFKRAVKKYPTAFRRLTD